MHEWLPFAFEKPEKGKLVLVWRAKREKYTVARYETFQRHEEDGGGEYEGWVGEYSTIHEVEPDDCWLPFPAFERTKVYE